MSKHENETPRIDSVVWRETGSQDDPRSRLLAQITVCGLPMHLEAYAVWIDHDMVQTVVDETFEHEWTGICQLNECPFETLEIEGREYVLIAQPHGD